MNTFEKELTKIENLKWLPWIGSQYQNERNRVMVYGESFYVWEGEDEAEEILNNPVFPTNLIHNNVMRNNKEINNNIRPHRNLERALFDKSRPSDEEIKRLWDHLSYNVIVQRSLPNLSSRPSFSDYVNGWKVFVDVIKVLKPNLCIFMGVEAFNALQTSSDTHGFEVTDRFQHEKVGNTYPRTAKIIQDDHETKLIFIKHPSKYFSWAKWSKFIDQESLSFSNSLRT